MRHGLSLVAFLTFLASWLGVSGVAAAEQPDFNGDGRPDVVFRHTVTGDNLVWLLRFGSTLRSNGRLQQIHRGAGPHLHAIAAAQHDLKHRRRIGLRHAHRHKHAIRWRP